MASTRETFFTPEQYLELERKSEGKSEFLEGRIFAMGGASARHVLIVANITGELGSLLKQRDCLVCSSDLRVRVSPAGLYTYPDVVVVGGPPEFADDQQDTLTNPTLIVEVLSPSTRDYDRGEKFQQYRRLPSLKEYLLVAQDKVHVEQRLPQEKGAWLLSETEDPEGVIDLVSVSCRLALREIYDKVDSLKLE